MTTNNGWKADVEGPLLVEYPIGYLIPPPDSIQIRFLPFACQDIDIKIIRRTFLSLIYLQFLAAIFVVAREIATN